MNTNILDAIDFIGLGLSGYVSQRAIVTLKTFIGPSIQTASAKTVAVFQMRNTDCSPGETIEMNRIITQSFVRKNDAVEIIETVVSGKTHYTTNLVGEFSDSLQLYLISFHSLKSLQRFLGSHMDFN